MKCLKVLAVLGFMLLPAYSFAQQQNPAQGAQSGQSGQGGQSSQGTQAKAVPNLPFSPGTPLQLEENGNVLVNGSNVPLRDVTKQDMGFFLPDSEGGMLWSKSQRERPEPNKNYMDAREIKLKVRELAEQLLANIHQSELRGKVGMPTSFVNQENFEQSSAFGRYVAEQMFHEFNQRGFAVREYRIAGSEIRMNEGDGDFFLSRAKKKVKITNASVVLVGTYYFDNNDVFINARLIRPSDGMVYRTAQMVAPLNPTLKTMLNRSSRRMEAGTLSIRSKKSIVEEREKKAKYGAAAGKAEAGKADLSVLDQGYDIH